MENGERPAAPSLAQPTRLIFHKLNPCGGGSTLGPAHSLSDQLWTSWAHFTAGTETEVYLEDAILSSPGHVG